MKWKDMTPMHKVAFVIACLGAIVVVMDKLLPDLFPVDPTCPAIAVFTVCEALVYWKERRKWAYLLLAAAVISTACFVLELCLLS
jgi:hypothetical protein